MTNLDWPVVAVVGATGAAGSTVLRILEERAFPTRELRALASPRSAGAAVSFNGVEVRVHAVGTEALDGVDIAFFAAGSDVAREFAPGIAKRGGVAVDKSSAYRSDPSVPLVVPEVNGDTLGHHHGIVSNPNCVASPLSMVLAPLHTAARLNHVTLSTYQAASGGGRDLLEELREQEQADAEGVAPRAAVYPHVLHGNVVPGGWKMGGVDTEEELKVISETRRVLGVPDLAISMTSVRVPVPVGHAASVWIETQDPLPPEAARDVLSGAPGVRVVDEPDRQLYPTPRDAAGTDDVLVGRIRRDHTRENGLVLFFAADNLRKGAATNAVQVAELLISPGIAHH